MASGNPLHVFLLPQDRPITLDEESLENAHIALVLAPINHLEPCYDAGNVSVTLHQVFGVGCLYYRIITGEEFDTGGKSL